MVDADREISQNEFFKNLNFTARLTAEEMALIKKAFLFGANWHQGQKRASGKDYFKGHCVHVAYHLHELQMPAVMIVAGLLHDTLEDTEVTHEMLEKEFGSEITFLVDSVSNLGTLKYRSYKRHVASLRKFFVAVAKDARVIVIKLCDRHHNLRTLQYLPAEKQKRIAEESMLIHAQLAQRLHIAQLHQQINDLAFPYVFPQDHRKVKELQKKTLAGAEKVITRIYRRCLIILSQDLGYQPAIYRRIKSTYSLYRKLIEKDWNIDSIYDIIALRIIVNSIEDCYKTLGLIHARWQPLQNRFKDYIAAPKLNGYQSLHTTIFTGDSRVVEIQIKTATMHRNAEFGLASHLSYKGTKTNDEDGAVKTRFSWLKQLEMLQDQENFDLQHYLQELKTDFFTNRIFVMTPIGDVIDLPDGATILDFAFAIHSDLGLSARGGRVNGIYKALKTPLKQQDIVEIITAKKITPQKNWLNWAKTANARQQIRHYLSQQIKSQK